MASGVCISTRGYRRRFIYELCNRRPDSVHSGEILFDEDGLPNEKLHPAERKLYLREEEVYGVRWLYLRLLTLYTENWAGGNPAGIDMAG